MFPFAIACGNCFILKPSEKVPMTPTRTAELLDEAGVPPGVYNVIHGDKVAVDALIQHPLGARDFFRRARRQWRSTSTNSRLRMESECRRWVARKITWS
jgi:hypothetical protein